MTRPQGRPDTDAARRIAAEFGLTAPTSVERLVSGHINESFALDVGARRVLLQWINPLVFPLADQVQDNVECVLGHLAETEPGAGYPTLLAARDGQRRVRAEDGLWRAMSFLPDRRTLTRPADADQARAGAMAVGAFDRALASLPMTRLHDVLHGFHDLRARLAAFDAARADAPMERLQLARAELDAVSADREARLGAGTGGPLRVIHGDPKFSNVLLSREPREPVDLREPRARPALLVDYDTVMPGALAHDFGDALRSAAAAGDEDAARGGEVRVPCMLAAAEGFLQGLVGNGPAGSGAIGREVGVPDADERRALPAAPATMAFMLGVRFLTDWLQGDRYFRIRHPQHNLQRAGAQLRLARGFAALEPRLDAAIDSALDAALTRARAAGPAA